MANFYDPYSSNFEKGVEEIYLIKGLLRTSHLFIYPLYLQWYKYKDLSLEVMPNKLTIRYFWFLELLLTYMRIWCCLNHMCLLLLGMMGLAWIRGTSIRALSCMEMAASMWGLKRMPKVEILELWSHHNDDWRFGRNIQDHRSHW
jgi:hypothetical protein